MAKLIYGMLMSLDGDIGDEHGFGWAAPDEKVHAYVKELGSSVGTHLYGRQQHVVALLACYAIEKR